MCDNGYDKEWKQNILLQKYSKFGSEAAKATVKAELLVIGGQ
jgi:hypothetical protein